MKNIALLILFIGVTVAYAQDLLQTTILDSFSVSFPYGKSAMRQKQQVMRRLNQLSVPEYGRVELRGYTDTVGSVAYNELLADKRLMAVQQCLENSPLKSLKTEAFNRNEQRFEPVVYDSLFRRVDVIVYALTPKFTFDVPINLQINFEPGTDVILPNSTESVNKLLTIMQFDSTLTVKLNGHVCCESDQLLSEKRALRVREYLVRRGINGKRITCEGFNNTVPIAEEINEEAMAMNRRVEVVFVKPSE